MMNNSSPSTPPNTNAATASKKNLIVLGSLIAVIVILLIVVAYLLGSNKTADNETENNVATSQDVMHYRDANQLTEAFVHSFNSRKYNELTPLFADSYLNSEGLNPEGLYNDLQQLDTKNDGSFDIYGIDEADSTHANAILQSNGGWSMVLNLIVENNAWTINQFLFERAEFPSVNQAVRIYHIRQFIHWFNDEEYEKITGLYPNIQYPDKLSEFHEQYAPLRMEVSPNTLHESAIEVFDKNNDGHQFSDRKEEDGRRVLFWSFNEVSLSDVLYNGEKEPVDEASEDTSAPNVTTEEDPLASRAATYEELLPDVQEKMNKYFEAFNDKRFEDAEFTDMWNAPVTNSVLLDAYWNDYAPFDLSTLSVSSSFQEIWAGVKDKNGRSHEFYIYGDGKIDTWNYLGADGDSVYGVQSELFS